MHVDSFNQVIGLHTQFIPVQAAELACRRRVGWTLPQNAQFLFERIRLLLAAEGQSVILSPHTRLRKSLRQFPCSRVTIEIPYLHQTVWESCILNGRLQAANCGLDRDPAADTVQPPHTRTFVFTHVPATDRPVCLITGGGLVLGVTTVDCRRQNAFPDIVQYGYGSLGRPARFHHVEELARIHAAPDPGIGLAEQNKRGLPTGLSYFVILVGVRGLVKSTAIRFTMIRFRLECCRARQLHP